MISNQFPLISVCIPCYNAEGFIAETLQAFINQTYSNFEIVIVDDCSTDGSLELLRRIAASDSRIKILMHSENAGAAAARNLAFENSTGKYIVFFDADDLITDVYLEKQVALMLHHSDTIIACELQEFYNNDISNTRENPSAIKQSLPAIDWLMADHAKGLNLTQCGMFLIPRTLIEQSGAWNEQLSLIDDFEFFPRLLLKAKFVVYNPEVKIYYRRDVHASLSNMAGPKALKSAFDALCATTNLLLAYENSPRVQLALANYWRGWIYHFYGNNTTFYQYGINQVKALTGKKYSPNNKGITGIFDHIFGWKLTKNIKNKINAR
jgi:glycosyltransferase involved in cell wall biosynthesis